MWVNCSVETKEVLMIVISMLIVVIAFLGRQLFNAQDKQFVLLKEISDFVHNVDKRLIKVETKML